jgi:hypothetical protein
VTAASEPDILAGVERAAKALGIDAHHGNDAPRGWRIAKASSNGGVLVMHQGATHHDPAPFWPVSPAIALAVCLLLASDAGPVDVGRCLDCKGRGWLWWDGEDAHPPGRIECPVCERGRKMVPVARMLLDAVSGDPTALEHLPKHADRLQAEGDPRGELLALALGPWSGEPTDWVRHLERRDWGEIGHPHTAAALRWLEWLTWAGSSTSTRPRIRSRPTRPKR